MASTTQLAFDILARDRASGALEKIGGSAEGLGGKLTKLGNVAKVALGGAVLGGVAALGAGFVQGVKDAASYETLLNKTAAVIKSTGNAAGISTKHVQRFAGELESISGVDEEQIINSQNVLATFTKIRNAGPDRIFDKATEAALNMSVALGQDLQGATTMVGKALNDPIKGITAMSRAGVQFTDQQKDQIKAMVEAGDTMGAQKIILAELETQFGGVAEAAGSGFSGSLARLQDVLGDTFREIATAILPSLTTLAEWLAERLPGAIEVARGAFGGIFDIAQQLFNVLFRGDFTGGPFSEDSPVIDVAFRIRDALAAVGETIGSVISAGFEALRTWWAENGETVRAGFQSIADAIGAVVTSGLAAVSGWWADHGQTVTDGFALLGSLFTDTLVPAVTNLFEAIRDELLPRLGDLIVWITANEPILVGLATVAGVYVAGAFAAWAASAAAAAGATLAAAAAAGLAALPFLAAALAIGAVAGALYWAWNESESFRFAVLRMVDYLSGAWEAWNKILDVIQKVVDWLGKVAEKIRGLPGLPGWMTGALDVVNGGGGGSSSGGLSNLFQGWLAPGLSFLPGFARGVTNFSGGLAIVGEGGPELLNLPRGSDVIPAAETRTMLADRRIEAHFYGVEQTTARSVLDRLAWEMA